MSRFPRQPRPLPPKKLPPRQRGLVITRTELAARAPLLLWVGVLLEMLGQSTPDAHLLVSCRALAWVIVAVDALAAACRGANLDDLALDPQTNLHVTLEHCVVPGAEACVASPAPHT